MDDKPLSKEKKHRDEKNRFFNPWPGGKPHGFGDFLRWVIVERRKSPRRSDPPPSAFPIVASSFENRAPDSGIVATWIGHSSFLLQMAGMNILLDPVWGERASPVSFAGPKRHVAPGFDFDELPGIDLVVISHDHYDHLDLSTVKGIVRDHPHAVWVAPRGVGDWLRARGARVAAELDWWQSTDIGVLRLTCTPAQHFSGRSTTNRNGTLWCGWTIRAGTRADDRAIYYAGDTALHPEFAALTRALGPFDAVFLPIGAYDPRWFMGPVHMAADESVSAYREIAGANAGRRCTFVAMHWGTFKLTDESLDEPPRLTRDTWNAAGLDEADLWIPRHGETRALFTSSND